MARGEAPLAPSRIRAIIDRIVIQIAAGTMSTSAREILLQELTGFRH
jgi:hypothetical protein